MATNIQSSIHTTLAVNIEPDESPESCYYDMLMIGKTGKGKSTVGNKYLGINPNTKALYEESGKMEDVIQEWGCKKLYFEMGADVGSVTKSCALLSNKKTMDRVLDTRGFADSETTRECGVMRGNLKNFRQILQYQRQYKLNFRRVLYFLPNRGVLRRADGAIQEEIQVMYGYFGKKVFDIMVVVATNDPDPEYQKVPFIPQYMEVTATTFIAAFNKATDEDLPKCPPIIYVPVNQPYEELRGAIISADVIQEEDLYFTQEYPKNINYGKDSDSVYLGLEISVQSVKETIRQNRGMRFEFENRCTRCAIKIVQDVQLNQEYPLRVIHENGVEEDYINSYCHPVFIPKYTRLQRFIGGIAHIVTLGAGKLYEVATGKQSWPGFLNSEEVCPVVTCGKSPGSQGCSPVCMDVDVPGAGSITTDHSKELDVLKIVEES